LGQIKDNVVETAQDTGDYLKEKASEFSNYVTGENDPSKKPGESHPSGSSTAGMTSGTQGQKMPQDMHHERAHMRGEKPDS